MGRKQQKSTNHNDIAIVTQFTKLMLDLPTEFRKWLAAPESRVACYLHPYACTNQHGQQLLVGRINENVAELLQVITPVKWVHDIFTKILVKRLYMRTTTLEKVKGALLTYMLIVEETEDKAIMFTLRPTTGNRRTLPESVPLMLYLHKLNEQHTDYVYIQSDKYLYRTHITETMLGIHLSVFLMSAVRERVVINEKRSKDGNPAYTCIRRYNFDAVHIFSYCGAQCRISACNRFNPSHNMSIYDSFQPMLNDRFRLYFGSEVHLAKMMYLHIRTLKYAANKAVVPMDILRVGDRVVNTIENEIKECIVPI